MQAIIPKEKSVFHHTWPKLIKTSLTRAQKQTAVLWDEQLWNEQLWIEDAYKATVFNTIKYTLNSGCIILRCVYFFHSAAF